MSRTEHSIKRFQAKLGRSWWWRRFADLVDRRQPDGTYRPFDYQSQRFVMTEKNLGRMAAQGTLEVKQPVRIKQPGATAPEKLPRPPGLTRQQHRRLYREACKLAGVPWRTERTVYTPRRLRGMTEVQRALAEEEEWQRFKAEFVRIGEPPDAKEE